MFDLTGRRAIVTGGAKGLGFAIATRLADAGARVAVVDREGAPQDGSLTAGFSTSSAPALLLRADVSDPGDVSDAFDAVRDEFGGLDILVNNAGTSRDEPFEEITAASWDLILANNARSSFLCAQAAMPIMRDTGGGRIIQITSVVAHQGALFGHAHYAASKSAQIALTKTLSHLAAPFRITVNAVAPGVIPTPLSGATLGDSRMDAFAASIPLGLGEPDDVAYAVVFLASDEARYITGATLDVNGGQYVR